MNILRCDMDCYTHSCGYLVSSLVARWITLTDFLMWEGRNFITKRRNFITKRMSLQYLHNVASKHAVERESKRV